MNENTATNSGLGNETGKIDFPPGFPEPQKKVIEALLLGLNTSAAARAGGVHRATVMRWIDAGGEFHRVLRREQGKQLDDAKRQAKSLAVTAAETVVNAVQTGDVGAGFKLLKELGVFDPMEKCEPTDNMQTAVLAPVGAEQAGVEKTGAERVPGEPVSPLGNGSPESGTVMP